MNEDFISSSMATGIRLPIGDEGRPGGGPAFPSTGSRGGAQPIKSPPASHGWERVWCGLARSPESEVSVRTACRRDYTQGRPIWPHSSGGISRSPTLTSKNEVLTQPQAAFYLFFLPPSAET